MRGRDETVTLTAGIFDFAALSFREGAWRTDGDDGEPSYPLLDLQQELVGPAVAVQTCIRRCLATKQLQEGTCSIEHVSAASQLAYILLR